MTTKLIPGKLYCINAITASYKQSDDVDVYDVKNLKSLNSNINLMFLQKEKVKCFGTKTSDGKRLIEEYEMLTFMNGQEKYFIFENKENFCKLIL